VTRAIATTTSDASSTTWLTTPHPAAKSSTANATTRTGATRGRYGERVVVGRVLQQELRDLEQAAGHQQGAGDPAGTAGDRRPGLVGTASGFDDDG
jgi:hypothetical protein